MPSNLPHPGIEPKSPALQVDSLPAEPQRKPKNTGVGSLSLLQWVFLTQELNQGLLHWASLVAQLVKNLSAMQITWVGSLGLEDSLEKGKATRSSILAWRIPWTV